MHKHSWPKVSWPKVSWQLSVVLFLALVGWLLLTQSLVANSVLMTTRYVAADGNCGTNAPCYGKLQAAVDAANDGDLLLVAAGSYTGVDERLRALPFLDPWMERPISAGGEWRVEQPRLRWQVLDSFIEAAESAGIAVAAVRIGAITAGSALMGVAGAFLTTAAFNAFFFNMVNGRGWVCIALVVFGSWRPGKALLGALLFGFFDALQLRLAQSAGDVLPYQFWLMVPFVLSILALVAVSRRAAYPQALMKPYRKGER